jgi:polysaccharide pyruvyl transferase WcaK-like protein
MTPQRLYIYGYYGSKNAGDEAFRLAFHNLLPSGSELQFIRPSELAGNQNLANQIEQDCSSSQARLIVGGGAIIGEPYFWEHLPPRTPFHIVSADIGSRDNLLGKYIPSLKRMQASWIRSESDTEELRNLAPWQPRIQHLPDIVFSLEADRNQREVVTAMPQEARNRKLLELMEEYCENTIPASQLRNKNMAIFLSDHYYDYKTIQSSCVLDGIEREASDTTYLRQLRLALDEITPYYNLYLFSLSYWYNSIDTFVGYRLARASKQAPLYNLVTRYMEPSTIIDLMPYFDTAISTKFHGLILPMTANVPVMNLGSSKKNRDLSQQMGLISIQPDTFNLSTFLSALKQVESVEYATSLAETRRLAHEAIHTTFSNPELWT